MAGPSVVVRVLGDLTGLSKSLDQTQKKGAAVSASLKKGFGTVFSTLNATGVLGPFQDAFMALDQGFGDLEERGHRVATAFQVAGGVAATTGALLTRLGSEDQQEQQQLAQAIDNTGHSWADYQGRVEAAVKSQERFGDTSAETEGALQVLTQATNDPTKAMSLLGLATDLAASKHESLSEASTQLARILNGNTRTLKEFGIEMPKVGKAAGDFATQADEVNSAVTQLTDKLHGQAAAAADTFTGHIHALTAAMEDQAAKIGQKYGPALTAVGSAVTVLSTGFKTYQSIMESVRAAQEAQTAVTEAQTVATEGLTAAEIEADIAGAPIELIVLGIVAAVAAMVAIGYEIGTHWKAIWGGIKDAVSAVWDWVKTNWPLLIGIILGPIGIIASQIYEHWTAIKEGVVELADAIVAAFKSAFNAVASLWNDSLGALSFKIPGWVPVLGGDKFSVPQIPHLAQGGLITQTGLIYAHAGEAITPAPAGIGGPAVNIENAQFNDPVDLDLLIKRVEFALSAGLPV